MEQKSKEQTTTYLGKYKFGLESLETIIETGEAAHLFEANHKETGWNKKLPLDPDYELLFHMERRGRLKFFTVRKEDGTLIGYAMFHVSESILHKTVTEASQLIMYIEPKSRGAGFKFMAYCGEILKEQGADFIWVHIPGSGKDITMALSRFGYDFKNYNFVKEL